MTHRRLRLDPRTWKWGAAIHTALGGVALALIGFIALVAFGMRLTIPIPVVFFWLLVGGAIATPIVACLEAHR